MPRASMFEGPFYRGRLLQPLPAASAAVFGFAGAIFGVGERPLGGANGGFLRAAAGDHSHLLLGAAGLSRSLPPAAAQERLLQRLDGLVRITLKAYAGGTACG